MTIFSKTRLKSIALKIVSQAAQLVLLGHPELAKSPVEDAKKLYNVVGLLGSELAQVDVVPLLPTDIVDMRGYTFDDIKALENDTRKAERSMSRLMHRHLPIHVIPRRQWGLSRGPIHVS